MRYEEPRPVSRAELAAALSAGDRERATAAMVSLAFYDPDGEWLTATFLAILERDDEADELRAIAATCLGHVARIHRAIDPRVVDVLRRFVDNPAVGPYAQNALDDIEVFTGG
jgi:hypothetical protein